MAQRTPIAQSPFTGQAKPAFVPTPNINPQAIQRAAASMPSHIFNTLSQVAGQTPSLNPFGQTPVSSGTNAAPNFAVPTRPGLFNPPLPAPSAHLGSGRLPFQPPAMLPPTAMPPPPPPPPLAPSSRPGSRSGNQWADIIQQDWQQPNSQSGRARANVPVKPRTPAYSTPGGSSQMSISPTQEETPNIRGDQTPLFDEWTY